MTMPIAPTISPPMAGFTHLGSRGIPAEDLGDAVEALGVEEPDQATEDADEREPPELGGVVEVVGPDVAEEGSEALDRSEDGVADRRGDEARQQRGGVEVVAVEDLRGQDGAAERRAEDGSDARSDSRRHGDTPVGGLQLEHPREERPEAGTDLAGRALPPA